MFSFLDQPATSLPFFFSLFYTLAIIIIPVIIPIIACICFPAIIATEIELVSERVPFPLRSPQVGGDPAEPTADDQLRADEAVRILGEYVRRTTKTTPASACHGELDAIGGEEIDEMGQVHPLVQCSIDAIRLPFDKLNELKYLLLFPSMHPSQTLAMLLSLSFDPGVCISKHIETNRDSSNINSPTDDEWADIVPDWVLD